MLVINPDECIDCGVCQPECPIDAIEPDIESSDLMKKINDEKSRIWPNITENKESPFGDALKDEKQKSLWLQSGSCRVGIIFSVYGIYIYIYTYTCTVWSHPWARRSLVKNRGCGMSWPFPLLIYKVFEAGGHR